MKSYPGVPVAALNGGTTGFADLELENEEDVEQILLYMASPPK